METFPAPDDNDDTHAGNRQLDETYQIEKEIRTEFYLGLFADSVRELEITVGDGRLYTEQAQICVGLVTKAFLNNSSDSLRSQEIALLYLLATTMGRAKIIECLQTKKTDALDTIEKARNALLVQADAHANLAINAEFMATLLSTNINDVRILIGNNKINQSSGLQKKLRESARNESDDKSKRLNKALANVSALLAAANKSQYLPGVQYTFTPGEN